MLKSFQKKMTLLYTLTTGIILTGVLFIILIYSEKLMLLRNNEKLQSCAWTIVTTIQSEHALSHSYLSRIEAENQIIINIEENGQPLLYKGSWKADTDREILIQRAKDFAQESNINIYDAPLSSGMQQSEIFKLKGDFGDIYKAVVIKLPFSDKRTDNYVNLILIHSMKPLKNAVIKQRVIFMLLDLAGIAALYFISLYFVSHLLKPIKENKKKQEQFFAAASHELRSPITVIQSSINAISANPSKTAHLTKNILSECRRLLRLTEDMLILSKTGETKWSASFSSIDMDTLLLETYEMYEPICRENDINLSLSLPDTSLPSITGDYERLKQIVVILLDNAVSHSYKKGNANKIEISVQLLRHKLKINIIDHGIGIPDEQKELVFDHFFRGDLSRGDKSHFGLGLGIASELTKLHRGHLSVNDTAGGGATFSLTLPI